MGGALISNGGAGNHWPLAGDDPEHTSFTTYVHRLGNISDSDKLSLLVNHVDAVIVDLPFRITTCRSLLAIVFRT